VIHITISRKELVANTVSQSRFDHSVFETCSLRNISFRMCQFVSTEFANCNFSNVEFYNCEFVNCSPPSGCPVTYSGNLTLPAPTGGPLLRDIYGVKP